MLEYRTVDNAFLTLNNRTVSGLIIPFNKERIVILNNNKYIYEVIKPEAINNIIYNNSVDIYCLLDDDRLKVLGRFCKNRKTKNTLTLKLKDDGLYFENELPKTSVANDLIPLIRDGIITSTSYKFMVNSEHDQTWIRKPNGVNVRIINNFVLKGISIVSTPDNIEQSLFNSKRSLTEYYTNKVENNKEPWEDNIKRLQKEMYESDLRWNRLLNEKGYK